MWPTPSRGAVTVTTVGTPVYQVVDSHLYAAPTDSFPSLFPNHFPTRIVHGPPYDQEYSDGLTLTGYPQKEVYNVAEFTDPSAVHLGYVLVPNSTAPPGSTFDYASGPIIPNDIFPITIQGDVYLNGALYEQNAFNISLPAQAGFDGRSHFLAHVLPGLQIEQRDPVIAADGQQSSCAVDGDIAPGGYFPVDRIPDERSQYGTWFSDGVTPALVCQSASSHQATVSGSRGKL